MKWFLTPGAWWTWAMGGVVVMPNGPLWRQILSTTLIAWAVLSYNLYCEERKVVKR